MAELIKYVVVCDCDGLTNVVAWIDDDRAIGDSPWVVHPPQTIPSRRGSHGRIDADGEYVSTDRFQHSLCGREIRLNSRHMGELLDTIAHIQRQIGYEMIPVTLYPGDEPIEQRRIIPFGLLCEVNGGLQRRKNATRRKIP